MTIEEIIKMARQIFDIDVDRRGRETYVCDEYGLADFAKLVAEHESKRLTDVAMKAAEKAVDVAMALEREECAKMCDVLAVHPEYASNITKLAAQAIRNRGQV